MHGEHSTHVADEFNLPSISQDFDHRMSVVPTNACFQCQFCVSFDELI